MTELAAAFAGITDYADRWLAFRQHFLRVPGVQAAVWADGELVLSTAHGLADVAGGVAMTPRHLFRVASHSKTFTATAMVKLAEAGRLRLDDRLDQHLPWTADTGIGDRLLSDLLGHSAGVIRDGLAADHWQLSTPFPDDAMLRSIAADAAIHPADERFKYSNIGFGLLGAVVAAVSGRTYQEFVADEVVGPLGLTDTAPDLVAARLSEYALGYTGLESADRRIPIEHIDTAALDAATGFTSTAADLVHWGAAHLPGDERLLGATFQKRMRRPSFDVDPHDAKAGRYGLGFDLRELHGHPTFGHGGGYPGHNTRLTIVPDQRLIVAVCTNAIDGWAGRFVDGLVALAVVAAGEPDGAPVGPEVDRYCGRYASLWSAVDIVRLGRRLLMLNPVADDPSAALMAFEPVGDDTFRLVRTPGFGSHGETLRFRFDPSGAVESVLAPGGVTMWPRERMTAFLETHDEVRLGDLADGPG